MHCIADLVHAESQPGVRDSTVRFAGDLLGVDLSVGSCATRRV